METCTADDFMDTCRHAHIVVILTFPQSETHITNLPYQTPGHVQLPSSPPPYSADPEHVSMCQTNVDIRRLVSLMFKSRDLTSRYSSVWTERQQTINAHYTLNLHLSWQSTLLSVYSEWLGSNICLNMSEGMAAACLSDLHPLCATAAAFTPMCLHWAIQEEESCGFQQISNSLFLIDLNVVFA